MKMLKLLLIYILAIGIAVSGIGVASALAESNVNALNNDQDYYATSKSPGSSVLVYPYYSSDGANTAIKNTQIDITNTNPSKGIGVHFYFIDGSSGAQADFMTCLTPKQTYSFLMSDFDPDRTGYIIAVAVDALTGKPVNHDYLIGDEYFKDSEKKGAVRAEGFQALFEDNVNDPQGLRTLAWNGFLVFGQNYAPSLYQTMNIPSIPSRAAGLRMTAAIDGANVGGSPSLKSPSTTGTMIGMLYDDQEQGQSFEVSVGSQAVNVFSDTYPRTVPRFTTVVSAGRTGWMRFTNLDSVRLLTGTYTQWSTLGQVGPRGANNMYGWGSTLGQFYMQNMDSPLC